jgi:hypothetical protein
VWPDFGDLYSLAVPEDDLVLDIADDDLVCFDLRLLFIALLTSVG